jgi:hypothetical protein
MLASDAGHGQGTTDDSIIRIRQRRPAFEIPAKIWSDKGLCTGPGINRLDVAIKGVRQVGTSLGMTLLLSHIRCSSAVNGTKFEWMPSVQ